jgi:peptide deformylase
MAKLGVLQLGDPLLRQHARPFALPQEAEDARRVVAELHSALERVAQAHVFGKGLGIAAPQIGMGRAAAVVRTPSGETITLLNPQIVDQSYEQDEQYEGCLSFFDVRGKVPRPLCIQVEHQDVDGSTHLTMFERGVARLVAHEIDHLTGMLTPTASKHHHRLPRRAIPQRPPNLAIHLTSRAREPHLSSPRGT